MANPARRHAQRELVHELIDWRRVDRRLRRYPAIGDVFPTEMFKGVSERPPYYCHYLAWRLGTYESEHVFHRLNELLSCASQLPNWEYERRSLINTAEIADFWALVWQLQVAEHLCRVGRDVCWVKSGRKARSPDLSAVLKDQRWYVECYVYRKSFDLMHFLDELLAKIDPQLHLRYTRCLPLSLPKGRERSRFLDEIVRRLQHPGVLVDAKKSAKREWPQSIFDDPNSSLEVHLDGDDANAYVPRGNAVGSPARYLKTALREAVYNKKHSNALAEHRPNCLAVNYALSTDFQLALSLRDWDRIERPRLGPTLDVLAVSAIGIDKRLSKREFSAVAVADPHDRKGLSDLATTR
ncbi:MAG: hypothetical protein F4X47_02505 [Gammaproteobacteria bacterium]|nr:hypothetical protein [Gammaproteobacteria bacterium]MYC51169.1 hypothetical protein [Gammaproteobacteria bacterium]